MCGNNELHDTLDYSSLDSVTAHSRESMNLLRGVIQDYFLSLREEAEKEGRKSVNSQTLGMIDYHYPIYKFKPRSIFPNLVTHFPTVDKQKKSRAKARGYIEKISPQKKKKKKKGKGKQCEVTQQCPALCDLMDCSLPDSSAHGYFQVRYWSGLPFPSPGDLPDLEIEPRSLALQADALPSEPPGKSFKGGYE